jgi:hypothetical protein
MTRRRELNGISGGLVNSFVSRNNDVGGYWAIGKLCSHSLQTGEKELSMDLLTKRISPPNPEFAPMLDKYGAWLVASLEKQQFSLQVITAAEVRISFDAQLGPDPMSSSVTGYFPFRCTVTLTDDLGRGRVGRLSGVVLPHDPRSETKSTRV